MVEHRWHAAADHGRTRVDWSDVVLLDDRYAITASVRRGLDLWDAAQWNSVDLDWTAAGELVVQFPSAVAKLDLETGALADRHCGWGFGLSDQPVEVGQGGPTICDLAR